MDALATAASDCAQRNRGVLDAFCGDHVVLTFNAVRMCPLGVQKAVSAAIHFSKALETNTSVTRIKDLAHRSDGAGVARDELLHLCAGITSGVATVGNMGSSDTKRFSIIGEVYSRATELEQLGRAHPQSGQRGLNASQRDAAEVNVLSISNGSTDGDLSSSADNAAAGAPPAQRSAARLVPFDTLLPYTIVVAARDADDVESMANLEYFNFVKLKHARAYRGSTTAGGGDGGFTPIARITKEHGEAADEWMYALKDASGAASHRAEIRNQLFQLLQRRDFDEIKAVIAANPDVPSDDVAVWAARAAQARRGSRVQ
jgi:hypothetical protein